MLEILLDGTSHKITTQNGQSVLKGVSVTVHLAWDADTALTLSHNGEKHRVLFLGYDEETRTLRIQINGKQAALMLTGQAERFAERIGVNMAASRKLSELRAPMPGLVRAIHVQPGDTVTKGDPLITLEAMKMENVLKAAADGTVSQVAVSQDAAVEKGVLLIGFD